MTAKVLQLPVLKRERPADEEVLHPVRCRHRWPSAGCACCERGDAPWCSPVFPLPSPEAHR